MKRIIFISCLLWVVLPAFQSCRAISSFLHDDGIVAEVGSQRLYRSELDQIIPKGLSAEDSTRMARQYINTWASDLIFLTIAEEQLSKSEKDVTAELEDYRKSLLKYRYEQLYVNERLDTAVSEEAVEAYYEAHPDKFVLARPVLKARFLRISTDSPSIEPIKKKMVSDEVEDLIEADSLAYSSAMKFSTWNNEWIDASILAREFNTDHMTMLSSLKNGWIIMEDGSGMTDMAYVTQIIGKGQPAPLEYSTPTIKDMIISSRKQVLINSLEQGLLKDARENGKFVIY